MACYHAQQSVEKVLKALLADREVDFPRTHGILDLNNAIKKLGYPAMVNNKDAVFLNSISLTPLFVQSPNSRKKPVFY